MKDLETVNREIEEMKKRIEKFIELDNYYGQLHKKFADDPEAQKAMPDQLKYIRESIFTCHENINEAKAKLSQLESYRALIKVNEDKEQKGKKLCVVAQHILDNEMTTEDLGYVLREYISLHYPDFLKTLGSVSDEELGDSFSFGIKTVDKCEKALRSCPVSSSNASKREANSDESILRRFIEHL